MALSTILKKMLIGRAFSNERGRIKLFNMMDWTLYPSRALAMNFQQIAEKNGADFLYKLGYDAGHDAADEMIKYMQLKPRAGWATQEAIIALLDFIGFGKTEFVTSKIQKDGHHHIILHVKDNPVIEHAGRLYGKKSMVCNWFMGVYSAHGEMELGVRNPKLVEKKCMAKGAPYCEWESRW